VNGVGSQALGVMSQGEIHSLALSLFLPRAQSPDSPFGFVVIDDPVQAMDPGKVDGLAQVLRDAAGERQVIVFTHDERLAESVRRQQIPAAVVEVQRGAESRVACRPIRDPASQYLSDAAALAKTEGLPRGAVGRAGPVFCRSAVEAACQEVVRRRRLGRGIAHRDVEAALTSAPRLHQQLALALFDNAERASNVAASVRNRWGGDLAEALRELNRGAHQGMTRAGLEELLRRTSVLVREIRRLSTE